MSSHARALDNKLAKEVKHILGWVMINAMKKNTSERGNEGEGVQGSGAGGLKCFFFNEVLNIVDREGPTEVTFEQRSEGGEGVGHVGLWEKSGPGRGNNRCKGPEAGVYLAC